LVNIRTRDGVRVRPRLQQLSNDRHLRTSADGRYPVAMVTMYFILSWTKNFSAKVMRDVTSDTDYLIAKSKLKINVH